VRASRRCVGGRACRSERLVAAATHPRAGSNKHFHWALPVKATRRGHVTWGERHAASSSSVSPTIVCTASSTAREVAGVHGGGEVAVSAAVVAAASPRQSEAPRVHAANMCASAVPGSAAPSSVPSPLPSPSDASETAAMSARLRLRPATWTVVPPPPLPPPLLPPPIDAAPTRASACACRHRTARVSPTRRAWPRSEANSESRQAASVAGLYAAASLPGSTPRSVRPTPHVAGSAFCDSMAAPRGTTVAALPASSPPVSSAHMRLVGLE